jgi:hypothetical protein
MSATYAARGGFAVAASDGNAGGGYLIEDSAVPGRFFSCRAGADLGQPAGAWDGRREMALRFARSEDARDFAAAYLPHHPHVRLVPVTAP